MKREIIERLAIDSAAGELNEDTEALFRAYLAEHPDASKWVENMLEIYEKTGAAIDAKTKHAIRADTGEKVVGTRHRSHVHWLPIARWAAVVVFAACVGAGVGWSRSNVLPQKQKSVTVSPSITAKQPSFDLEDIGEGFWRNKAIAMLNSPSEKIHTNYIAGPSLWDKYRKYIKEKHYE